MHPKVIKTLGFDVILDRLAECACSGLGKEAAKKLLPAKELEQVKILMQETAEAESMVRSLENDPMMSFNDIGKEIKRLRAGASLNGKELLSVNLLLRACKRASKGIRKEGSRLALLAADLFYHDTIISDIENAILSEDEISDGASEELMRIRRQMRQENETIRQKLQGLIRSKEMSKYLQDAIVTMRNGRYVIPVKQEYRGQVKGLIHGESGSGQTLFIEPMSVVEANNRLSELEAAEKQEIERILWALSDEVRAYTDELELDLRRMAYLDLVFAKGRLAVKWNCIAPDFNTEGIIRIIEGRHPMIDPKTVIPVSIEMGKEIRSLIVTGPNTGGKTVTLKLCGIFSMMAQSGMMLPAKPGATLPIFKKIFADIGDEQSIEQSLSTFSSHMTNIIRIVRDAGISVYTVRTGFNN